jgi:hypothetical protein
MSVLDDVATTVGIVDGRVAMTADGEADVYVDTPRQPPLSATETHATLRVVGDDYRAEIELDADDCEELLDALAAVADGTAFEEEAEVIDGAD